MTPTKLTERPPVIAIMGHIDHGKSTLLDYIRKTNLAEKEAGGITQHVSAYEVVHEKDGVLHKITFLDTPGHEAFTAIRSRGAQIADIAILVISAEDGVKPQTIEALKIIQKDGLPFLVAINKIDKPGADLEWAKQNLAENEIYVEGYGGSIPYVPISAKTGQGIPELLDMMLLVAELEELKGDPTKLAEGFILESNLDTKKGVSATIIIKDGSLKKGTCIASDESSAPIRMIEDFLGRPIQEATFSSPVKVIGWSKLPTTGAAFITFSTKKEAEAYIQGLHSMKGVIDSHKAHGDDNKSILPLVIKADTGGSLEAVVYELSKLTHDRINIRIIQSGIGTISEGDVKIASGNNNALVVGFNVKVDSPARNLAERTGIIVENYDIIYKLTERIQKLFMESAPTIDVEEISGRAKIIKIFSTDKDKQILGGKVESGSIGVGSEVKILRRDFEIGKGRIRELQQQKSKTSEVVEGKEFGSMIESKTSIAPGDRIEAFAVVKKK